MLIKTSVSRVIACPRRRNDVTGPSGKPEEEDRRQHCQCQRRSFSLSTEKSSLTLIFFEPQITGDF